jgi:hypothetical protein
MHIDVMACLAIMPDGISTIAPYLHDATTAGELCILFRMENLDLMRLLVIDIFIICTLKQRVLPELVS